MKNERAPFPRGNGEAKLRGQGPSQGTRGPVGRWAPVPFTHFCSSGGARHWRFRLSMWRNSYSISV